MSEPALNSTASVHLTVAPSDLASAVNLEPADAFPPVFATSRMVGLMEVAAARVLRPHLSEGEASVGVSVDVVHTAATPAGATATATARVPRAGRKVLCLRGLGCGQRRRDRRGTHKRAVVATERLVAGAARRGAEA